MPSRLALVPRFFSQASAAATSAAVTRARARWCREAAWSWAWRMMPHRPAPVHDDVDAVTRCHAHRSPRLALARGSPARATSRRPRPARARAARRLSPGLVRRVRSRRRARSGALELRRRRPRLGQRRAAVLHRQPPRERARRGRPSGDRGAARDVGGPRLHVGPPGHERQGRLDLRPHRGARPAPGGRGSWPAIWTLGSTTPLRWPDDGEIDIMEHVGFDHGVVHASVHTRQYNHVQGTQRTAQTAVPDVVDRVPCLCDRMDRRSHRHLGRRARLFHVRCASRRAGAPRGRSTRRSTCC